MLNIRRVLLGLAILFLPSLVEAEGKQYSSNSISATSANTAVSFIASGDVNPFVARKIIIVNTGATNEIYISFDSTTSNTTKGFYLAPGLTISIWAEQNEPGWTGIGIICAGGETSTARVTAIRVQP